MNRQEARETLVYAIGEFVDNCIDAGDADKYWEAMTYYDSLPEVAPSNNDLISRADAVSTIIKWASGEGGDIVELIETLPSAEQVTSKLNNRDDSLLTDDSDECKEQKSKLDLIRRHDAIEAIVNSESNVAYHDASETVLYGSAFRQNEIIDILESLPSASVGKGYDEGYQDGYFAKETDRAGDCDGCKFIGVSARCEGCCRNYADGYKGGDVDEID